MKIEDTKLELIVVIVNYDNIKYIGRCVNLVN